MFKKKQDSVPTTPENHAKGQAVYGRIVAGKVKPGGVEAELDATYGRKSKKN